MKIIKYSVSKKSKGSTVSKSDSTTSQSNTNQTYNPVNDWFEIINGVLVCKYPLSSIGEITAFNTIANG